MNLNYVIDIIAGNRISNRKQFSQKTWNIKRKERNDVGSMSLNIEFSCSLFFSKCETGPNLFLTFVRHNICTISVCMSLAGNLAEFFFSRIFISLILP